MLLLCARISLFTVLCRRIVNGNVNKTVSWIPIYMENFLSIVYLLKYLITIKFKTRSSKFISIGKLLTYYRKAAFPSGLSLHTEGTDVHHRYLTTLYNVFGVRLYVCDIWIDKTITKTIMKKLRKTIKLKSECCDDYWVVVYKTLVNKTFTDPYNRNFWNYIYKLEFLFLKPNDFLLLLYWKYTFTILHSETNTFSNLWPTEIYDPLKS